MNEVAMSALEKLELLATKMGMGAKSLFPYLIKQQYVLALVGTMFMLISLGWFICLPKLIKKGKENDWDDAWVWVIIGTIVSIIIFFISLTYIVRMINPEFYALRQIIYWIK